MVGIKICAKNEETKRGSDKYLKRIHDSSTS